MTLFESANEGYFVQLTDEDIASLPALEFKVCLLFSVVRCIQRFCHALVTDLTSSYLLNKRTPARGRRPHRPDPRVAVHAQGQGGEREGGGFLPLEHRECGGCGSRGHQRDGAGPAPAPELLRGVRPREQDAVVGAGGGRLRRGDPAAVSHHCYVANMILQWCVWKKENG